MSAMEIEPGVDRTAVNFLIKSKFPLQQVHPPNEKDQYYHTSEQPLIFSILESIIII